VAGQSRAFVVTGGASGIGFATARLAALRGDKVVVCDLDESRVEEAVAEIRSAGGEAMGLVGDVTSYEAVRDNVRSVIDAFGRVDVLVNSAGVASLALPEDVSNNHWHRELAVCLTGSFYWSREVAVASMIPGRKGTIVNIGSGAAFSAIPASVSYVTAKHGLVGMTKSLAIDGARHGIRVNCVCPGHTWTALARQIIDTEPERMQGPLEAIPLGDGAYPDDIANAVLFLSSEDASSISGSTLTVDGGALALMAGYKAP
jgi:NAD(P)-dependent dehydrogenase (short-subunit alcohol dehydrogenase family)